MIYYNEFLRNDDWEKRIKTPDMKTLDYEKSGNVRHFHLTAEKINHNILSNVSIKALGYNGLTPGPVIIIKEGEWVNLTVENHLDEDTALHVHGLSKPNSQDGTPDINPNTPKIRPNESFTYKFLCWQSGTFFYHSSNPIQIAQGLVGAFIVLPKDESIKIDEIPYLDYVFLIQQWEVLNMEFGKLKGGLYEINKIDRNPNFFTINGKAFPYTSPIYFKYGEKIKLRFIAKSSHSHTIHLHGHDFQVVKEDGFDRNNLWTDTIDLPSGKRIEVDVIANNVGIWPMNGTKTFHQTNNGVPPGGMISKVIYIE